MSRRGGLGRGLGALIPTGPSPSGDNRSPDAGPDDPAAGPSAEGSRVPVQPTGRESARGAAVEAGADGADGAESTGDVGARYAEIPVADVRPNPKQPRQAFDDDALAELVHSLREVGFLQPIVVRPVEEGYELVMGDRRWRAAQQAGFTTIPAIVKETADDAMLRDALLENLHRQQLNPLEEAAAYAQLLEEFGATHDELAKRIGRSRPQISNTIRLLNLPPTVQRRVAVGVLSAGHARALLAVDDADAQDRLAHRIVAEGLSVRAVEEIVALGEAGGPKAKAPRAARRRAPGLDDLAAALSDHFETRAKVELGRAKGKITIEFASIDDLERIIASMAPSVSAQLRREDLHSAD